MSSKTPWCMIMTDAPGTIIICPNCGAKNRVNERGGHLQAVCGKCRTPLPVSDASTASNRPIALTDSNYAAVLQQAGARPILVDAWAPWCGPCRMIAPTIDALAAESHGRYLVAKLNVDENPRIASQHNISSIPTLLIFKSGQLVDQLVGLHPRATIAAALSRHL